MYRIAMALTAVALVACASPVPDSGSGVGFQNYSGYRSDLERVPAGEQSVPPQPILPANPLPPQAAGRPPVAATQPPLAVANASPTTVESGWVPVVTINNPGISDEQDFDAVAGRESIQSDRERLAAQREAYRVIQPTALPSRSGSSGPNIVQFALSTGNAVGQRVHRRFTLFPAGKFERNCVKYASPDLAQEAFLQAGGPEKDKMGLDPDGDGFACGWDPTPFRRVTANR